MIKKTLTAACMLGATAASMAMFGTGVAAADDYAGQKYSDASSAMSDAGKTPIIANRFGDELGDADCVVTHSQNAPFVSGDDFAPVTDVVQVYLNCDAGVATATKAGNSAASPEGRAAIQAAKDEAAKEAAAKSDKSGKSDTDSSADAAAS